MSKTLDPRSEIKTQAKAQQLVLDLFYCCEETRNKRA